MSAYRIRHADNEHDTPGTWTLEAPNDAAAVQQVRELVEQGFRNTAWASVQLKDGRCYIAHNTHGKARGTYQEPSNDVS